MHDVWIRKSISITVNPILGSQYWAFNCGTNTKESILGEQQLHLPNYFIALIILWLFLDILRIELGPIQVNSFIKIDYYFI